MLFLQYICFMDEHQNFYYYWFLYFVPSSCLQLFLIFKNSSCTATGIFILWKYLDVHLCLDIPFPQLHVFFFYMCSAKIQQYLAIKLLLEISSPLLECLFWLQPQKWLSIESVRTVKLFHGKQWWFLFSGFPDHKFSSVQNARLPSGKMAHLWDVQQRAK